MKNLKIIVGLFFLLNLMSFPLYAEIYSWIDEKGVRHFADKEPADQGTNVEVIEEVKSEDLPDPAKRDDTAWRKHMEQKRAVEEADESKKKEKKLAIERAKKEKSAYQSLKKIEAYILSDIEWSEYRTLLAEARSTLNFVVSDAAKPKRKTLLSEAYSSYEMALQLRTLHISKKKQSLNKLLKQMNEAWKSDAKTYYSVRDVCWQRAVDILNLYDQ